MLTIYQISSINGFRYSLSAPSLASFYIEHDIVLDNFQLQVLIDKHNNIESLLKAIIDENSVYASRDKYKSFAAALLALNESE